MYGRPAFAEEVTAIIAAATGTRQQQNVLTSDYVSSSKANASSINSSAISENDTRAAAVLAAVVAAPADTVTDDVLSLQKTETGQGGAKLLHTSEIMLPAAKVSSHEDTDADEWQYKPEKHVALEQPLELGDGKALPRCVLFVNQ